MLTTIGLTIGSVFINGYVGVINGLGGAMPSWFTVGINWIYSATGQLDLFFPMYAHPELSGPVAVFGIINIVGFLATICVVAIFAILVSVVVVMVLRALPWNTQG